MHFKYIGLSVKFCIENIGKLLSVKNILLYSGNKIINYYVLHRMALSARQRRNSLAKPTFTEINEDSRIPNIAQATVKMNNQGSRAEVPSRDMESKTATLYLSRSTSRAQSHKPDHESNTGRSPEVDKGSQDGHDTNTPSSKKTSVASLTREFTFTGYDIMADGK